MGIGGQLAPEGVVPTPTAKCATSRGVALPSNPRLIVRPSSKTVTRKLFGNIGLDRPCRTDVGLAACVFAFLELGEAPPIERARKSRPELQGFIEIGNGLVQLSLPQKGKTKALKDERVARRNDDGLVEVANGAVVLAWLEERGRDNKGHSQKGAQSEAH